MGTETLTAAEVTSEAAKSADKKRKNRIAVRPILLKRPKTEEEEAREREEEQREAMEVTLVVEPVKEEPPKVQAPPDAQLFVFGFSSRWKDEDLKNMFDEFGTVLEARVGIDKASGRSKGFGFVSFLKHKEAKAAQDATNGLWMKKKSLRVTFRDPNAPSEKVSLKVAKKRGVLHS